MLNNLGLKTRILQYIFFISTVIGCFVLSYEWILLALIMYVILVTLGGNIGLHRYYGHNTFNTSELVEKVLAFCSHYIGLGSVISWVGQHRYHHAYADTDKDIHSPHTNNIWRVMFGLWKVPIRKAMIINELRNDTLRFYHDNYFIMHGVIISVYICIDVLFGSYFFFSLYAMPNFLCLVSGYVGSFVTHTHGYRTYNTKDKSTNSWIANIISIGEGWHNNHHQYPNNWNTKEKPWEWDFPAFVIKQIKI